MPGKSYKDKLELAHIEILNKIQELKGQLLEKEQMVKKDEPIHEQIKITQASLTKHKVTVLDLKGIRDEKMKNALRLRRSLIEKDFQQRIDRLNKSLKLDPEEINNFKNQVKVYDALNIISSDLGEIISQKNPSKDLLSAKLKSLRVYYPGDEDEKVEFKEVYRYLEKLETYLTLVEILDDVELKIRSFDDFEEVRSHLYNAKEAANKYVPSLLKQSKSNIQRVISTPVLLGFKPNSIADYKFELGKSIFKKLTGKKRYEEVIRKLKDKETIIDKAMEEVLGKPELDKIKEQTYLSELEIHDKAGIQDLLESMQADSEDIKAIFKIKEASVLRDILIEQHLKPLIGETCFTEIMKLENQIQALGEREYQRQIEPEIARKKERQKAKVAQPPKDAKDGFVFHANPAGSSSDKLSLRFLVKDWIII